MWLKWPTHLVFMFLYALKWFPAELSASTLAGMTAEDVERGRVAKDNHDHTNNTGKSKVDLQCDQNFSKEKRYFCFQKLP